MSDSTSIECNLDGMETMQNRILSMMIDQKLKKFQQSIAQEVNETFKDWEIWEIRSNEIRKLVKKSTVINSAINNQCDILINFIEKLSSLRNVNTEAITMLQNQETRLANMLHALNQLHVYKENRKTKRFLRKFKDLLFNIKKKLSKAAAALQPLAEKSLELHCQKLESNNDQED